MLNQFKLSSIKESFKEWSKFDYFWLIICNLVILGCEIIWKDPAINVIIALLGISANILVAKGNIYNYPLGILNVLGYGIHAFNCTLYGDFTLNILYYFPMNIIGWYMWAKALKKNDNEEIIYKSLTLKGLFLTIICSILAIISYGYWLDVFTNDITAYWDSTSTILSIVSMILMVKYYKEQWVGWILVNIASIIMWWNAYTKGNGDLTTLMMWVVYLANSIYGLIMWYKQKEN